MGVFDGVSDGVAGTGLLLYAVVVTRCRGNAVAFVR